MTWSINLEVKDGQVAAESVKVVGTPPDGPVTVNGYQYPDGSGRSVNVTANGINASVSVHTPAALAPKAAELDLAQFARDAYEKYGEATGGKNYQGLPMPTWEELGDTIRGAWVAATTAVVDRVRERP